MLLKWIFSGHPLKGPHNPINYIFFCAAAFTVSVPGVIYSSTGGFPVNVVSTTYNKWATLPYLQLSGVNYQDTLAIGGLASSLLRSEIVSS